MNDVYQEIPESYEEEKEEVIELNPIQRAYTILFSPMQVFKAIKNKSALLVPMLVIPIILLLLQLPLITPTKEYILEELLKNPAISEEVAVTLSNNLVTPTVIFTPIFVIIGWLIASLYFWIGAKLLHGKGKYSQFLSMVANIGWISIIQAIIATVSVLVIGTQYLGIPITSVATLLPESMKLGFVGVIFKSIEIFAIWQVVLAIIGISEITGFSKLKSTVMVVIGFIGAIIISGVYS